MVTTTNIMIVNAFKIYIIIYNPNIVTEDKEQGATYCWGDSTRVENSVKGGNRPERENGQVEDTSYSPRYLLG